MLAELLNIIMNDGHFGDLPQSILWHQLRNGSLE